MEYKCIYNTVKNVCFRDVVYANGKWVFTALGVDENTRQFDETIHVCSSSDLVTFTDTVIYKDMFYSQYPQITYGNGVYLIVTYETDNTGLPIITRTSDLKTFTKVVIKNQDFYGLVKIKFINGQFIAVGGYGYGSTGYDFSLQYFVGQILTSKDGINWQKKATLKQDFNTGYCCYLNGITYYNGYYYTFSKFDKLNWGKNSVILKSSNLTDWEKCNFEIFEGIIKIESGINGMVAITDNKTVLFSSDGENWQRVFTDNNRELKNCVYGNGIYMIMAYPDSVAFSKNGIDWEWIYKSSSGENYGMAFSQEQQMFLICGNWWIADDTGSIRTISISRDIISSQIDNEMLYIYDLDFNFVGIIDSFKSLRWRRKYFEAGEFEIVVSADESNLDMLKENRLVIRNNYTEAGIIETIKISDDGTDEDLTISGRFLSSILDRRIVKSTINFNGSSVDGMKALLYQMTPFPNFEIESTMFDSKQITFQCTYKNVYDYLIKLSKYSNVGFRIVPNLENKVFIFENYQGLDRTNTQKDNERYAFSDDEFTIDNATLIKSNSDKINYALVGGQGEGESRVVVEAKNETTTGFDLYEAFVDSRNSSNSGISEEEYKKALIQEGYNSLKDGTNSFEFNAIADDYKDKFDLGDIVDVVVNKWGYTMQQRIVEIEEVIEDGKKTIRPVTGSPAPESWVEEN